MNAARRKSVKMTLPEDSTVEFDQTDEAFEEEGTINQTGLSARDKLIKEGTELGYNTTKHEQIQQSTKQQDQISKSKQENILHSEEDKTVWRTVQNTCLEDKPLRNRRLGLIHQQYSASHEDLRNVSNNNRRLSKDNLNLSAKDLHLRGSNRGLRRVQDTTVNQHHQRASTENLHLLHRNQHLRRVSVPHLDQTRSLPVSPVMSPRLMRRAKENSGFIPCPPDSPKSNRKHIRRSSNTNLNHIKNMRNPESHLTIQCAEDEEIRILNLSGGKPVNPTDDILLKFAIHRSQSVKSLPNAMSPPPTNINRQLPTNYSTGRRKSLHNFQRCQSAMSLPNSPPQTPIGNADHPSGDYLASRRRTVALDRGIQLRKTFEEWLNTKTQENRRRSLHTLHVKEIERLREEQSKKERFDRGKTFDEWKYEKEERLRQQICHEKEKTKILSEQQVVKEKTNEELREKKYNEWLVKKFEQELRDEEQKIEELRNREKLKQKKRRNSK
ncbi:trichohyalin-like isoform X1 [Clytia hemisphaerica]|uniref:Uncharacterized protein n=2 Tax=Clytia hemisphaerica TaxID=252671 RepID=A0A7M5V3P0_9CNID